MTRILEDIRVLDLTMFLAGPFAGRILADLGAEVIKVEPLTGDPSRRGQGLVPGSTPHPQFVALHRNKRSITIDLKQPEARKVFYELVARSDVLVENYRPGVTKRLGIDYDALAKVNPRLVYCSMSGFGSNGPDADKPAFDAIIQAISGTMSITGTEDRPPSLMGLYLGDLAAPSFGVHGILAALYARQKRNQGCHLDMSLLEGILYLAPGQTQTYFQKGEVSGRHGSGYGGAGANARAFLTADNKYVEVMCPYPKFQESLRQLIGSLPGFEQAMQDARFATPDGRGEHLKDYWGLLDKAFKTKTLKEWLDVLNKMDVPCAPINTIAEAVQNPQLLYRGFVSEVDVPGLGKKKTVSSPFNFNSFPRKANSSPPILGEHTAEVLKQVLGYTSERIAALKAAKDI